MHLVMTSGSTMSIISNMDTGKKKPYAILVFGAPMSGKTTFAEHFSESINAPFLNLSKLEKEFKVSQKLEIELVNQFAKSKATIIIEGHLDTEAERKEIRDILGKAGYKTVVVCRERAVCGRRRHLRGDEIVESYSCHFFTLSARVPAGLSYKLYFFRYSSITSPIATYTSGAAFSSMPSTKREP